MAKKKYVEPEITILPKQRDVTAAESETIKKDVTQLRELGFKIPLTTVGEVGEPKHELVPPKGVPMHKWRADLEKAGFEVVSNLKPEHLGFSAQRRVMKGKGWT